MKITEKSRSKESAAAAPRHRAPDEKVAQHPGHAAGGTLAQAKQAKLRQKGAGNRHAAEAAAADRAEPAAGLGAAHEAHEVVEE